MWFKQCWKLCRFFLKKYQDHIPCSFAFKLVSVHDKFSKHIVFFFWAQNAASKFIKEILKDYEYFKRVAKQHFNENLIMTEEEEQFQSSKTCWICETFIDDKKVRDHCHITGKFKGAAHWSCNINLRLTKKVLVIFHNKKVTTVI